MFCLFPNHQTLSKAQLPEIEHQVDVYQREARDARITTIFLGFLSLFVLAVACTLYGVGTLSPTTLGGLGILPYMVGFLVGSLSCGLVVGTLVFACKSLIVNGQAKHLQHFLQTQSWKAEFLSGSD